MPAADVVVVGAGLAGLATAWHLAPHLRVLLLEMGDAPGAEATAQNAGMVRRLGEDPFERALALRTAEWLADPGEDWADLAPSRAVGALIALVDDPTHLHDAAAHLRARGVRLEAVSRPSELAPALAGARLSQAWWLPDERVADAHAITTGLLRGARRHGAELRCRVRVTGLRIDGGRLRGVDTDAGPIEAGRVVLAAGAWCGALAAAAGLHRPLFPIRRTLLQTAPHPLSRPEHPWAWIDDAGLYLRPETGGWLVSGCDESVDPPGPGPGSRGPVDPERRARALDKLERLLPALADTRVIGGWTGLRTFAPDRRPLLGADPALPGLWWCAGLGGFGVTCGFAAGEVVATWMGGGRVDWLRPDPVSPGRPFPRRWPLRPDGDLGSVTLIGGEVPVVPPDR